MKAFFDTNIYINTFFKKKLSRERFSQFFLTYDIFVCPVVKHELLLGTIRGETRKELESFFDECPLLPAPGLLLWSETTKIMRKLNWKENHQQNDILIALTARDSEATLVTYDRHFERIQKEVDFEMVLLRESDRESSDPKS